jgi:hypothetical protein
MLLPTLDSCPLTLVDHDTALVDHDTAVAVPCEVLPVAAFARTRVFRTLASAATGKLAHYQYGKQIE